MANVMQSQFSWAPPESFLLKQNGQADLKKYRGEKGCWQVFCSHLWCKSVVVCGLAGEQDMRKALFLSDHDVSESTVALALSHVVPEPLVKHVALLLSQFPLY